MAAYLAVCVLGLPWAGAAGVWLIGDRHARARDGLAIASSAAAALASLVLTQLATPTPVLSLHAGSAFGDFTLVPDALATLMAAIAATIGCLSIVYSVDSMRGESGVARYEALILVFIGGMAGLVLTGSLLLLLLFWEVVGLCSFALIAFHADRPAAVAGGIRALVITQLGGLGLLAAVLATRASLGSDQIEALLLRAREMPPAILALIAYGVLIAAAAKSAQVPFHTWLPAAMEAPTPVSALIHAATMVNAGVYVLLRFFPAFVDVPGWRESVLVIGITSAVLAAVMALVSDDLKRVLAYSTISQLGYLFYAVGVGAMFAAQAHLLSHAIFKALLFLAAGAVIAATGTRDLRRLGGLSKQMPWVRNLFLVGALALAGVPVLNGFWSKDLILDAGLADGPAWAFGAMLVCGALTGLYTARLVWRVFFAHAGAVRVEHDGLPLMRLAMLPLALGCVASAAVIGTPGLLSVLDNPVAPVALAVVLVGAAAWWQRPGLGSLAVALAPVRRAAAVDFGFVRLDGMLAHGALAVASALRTTQNGRLSWNLASSVAGLIVIVAIFAWGAPR